MPIEFSTFLLPGGARCGRVICTGALTTKEAELWIQQIGPGGPLSGLPILSLSQDVTSTSNDALRHIAAHDDSSGRKVWMGIVMTNPVIRVTSNFLARVTGAKKQRIFATEAEAIQWLDERVRESTPPALDPPGSR